MVEKTEIHDIAAIGLGYVGLSTALCFSSRGFSVLGYDVDKEKINQVNSGKASIYEPGLEKLLRDSIKKNLFRAESHLEPSRFYFITVGTPSNQDGSIDLSYIEEASRTLGKHLSNTDGYRVVVVKSTVTPGTTENKVKPIIESESGKRFGKELGLAMNPEFLSEGSAINDTLNPERIIIGEYDKKSGDELLSLYKKFYGKRMPKMLRTSIINAELIKYANNAFLATKVSFINMIANLCQKLPGADVEVVAKGIGMDSRIGQKFLRAGPGWGGSCFPKDVKALKHLYSELGLECQVLDGAIGVNEKQPFKIVELAEGLVGKLKGKKVAVLGLAFKPNTDDVRDAVSLKLIRILLERGAFVSAYDPVASEKAKKELGQEIESYGERLQFTNSAKEALSNSECCIIVTEWDEFRKLEPNDFSAMKEKAIVDARRVLSQENFEGFNFTAIGLGVKKQKVVLTRKAGY